MKCPSCGADLPAEAQFCIECGTNLGSVANTGATVYLPRAAKTAVPCRACGTANADFAVFCVYCGRRLDDPVPQSAPPPLQYPTLPRLRLAPSRQQQHNPKSVIGALFLIGIGGLFLLKLPFWPGILFLVGATLFISESLRGRSFNGLNSLLWLCGLGLLIALPNLWCSNVLLLIGLSVLFDIVRRRAGRP